MYDFRVINRLSHLDLEEPVGTTSSAWESVRLSKQQQAHNQLGIKKSFWKRCETQPSQLVYVHLYIFIMICLKLYRFSPDISLKHTFAFHQNSLHNSGFSCRNSSVGRALDWRSKGPWFDPGFRQMHRSSFQCRKLEVLIFSQSF